MYFEIIVLRGRLPFFMKLIVALVINDKVNESIELGEKMCVLT